MSQKCQNRIAVSGGSGFVGRALCRALREAGWTVTVLDRKTLGGDLAGLTRQIQGVAGVINLAGAPILGRRWNFAYKRELVLSRVEVTRRLIEAVAASPERPAWLISTSAVGYYQAGRRHTETDFQPADDFLGRLTRDWEAEAARAVGLGLRTVIFRLGVVLGPGGGALAPMLPIFRLGLGGTIGRGAQALSWISLDDATQAYLTASRDPSWQGIYNLTAPNPTTNAGFTRALSLALCRPAFLPVPGWLLALRFGEGAKVLTRGQEVIPQRLLAINFPFAHAQIDQAIDACLAGRVHLNH